MRDPKKIGQKRVRNENKLTRSVEEILNEHNVLHSHSSLFWLCTFNRITPSFSQFDDVVRRVQDPRHGFQVKDRTYLFTTYENCFNGNCETEMNFTSLLFFSFLSIIPFIWTLKLKSYLLFLFFFQLVVSRSHSLFCCFVFSQRSSWLACEESASFE